MGRYVLDKTSFEPKRRKFYYKVLTALRDSKIPYLVGGAYALGCYTGIMRDTKDFDIFVKPEDTDGILNAFSEAGYKTELTDGIWIGKAFHNDELVDVIFGSANGIAIVDEAWFTHASEGVILEFPVKFIPPEEMIWSKAFVMTRDRYDGADIAHLMLKYSDQMDWQRLLLRFDRNWRVLFNYFVLFGFIYPSERDLIPTWIMDELSDRLATETHTPPSGDRVCRGTLFSTTQFEIDIKHWKFSDPRTGIPLVNSVYGLNKPG